MADRFRDLEILIGARADLQAYQEVEDTLADLDLLAEEISRNLDEANNRELRNISRRVQAYKRLESAYEQGEATVHDLRRAHDQLADSMDKLNEKANNVRGGRAEEDLRAFERQTVAQKRAQEQQLNSNLDASLREQREHVDKLSRIDKEHERQRHQINSTAEQAKAIADGDKQAQAGIDRLRDRELQDLKKQYDLQQKTTKELLRRAQISGTSRVSQLKKVSEEAGLKAQQKVDKERERTMRLVRRTEEDLANMRLRNERAIAALRERAQDRERRGYGPSATKKGFDSLRNLGGTLVGVHILQEMVRWLRTTALALSNAHQEVENLNRSFVSLNKGSLLNANVLLSKIDRSLLFSAKRIDLFRISNLALNSGIASLDARLPGLVANIRTVSLALGRDVVEDVERVIKAIAKMETELLDELGIATRATAAHEDYARALGRTAQSLTAVERLEAFAIATSKELQDKADRLTSVIHLQQQAVGELQATWEQVTLAIGGLFSGVLLSHLDTLRSIVTEMRLILSLPSDTALFQNAPRFATSVEAVESNSFIEQTKRQIAARTGGFEPPTQGEFSSVQGIGSGKGGFSRTDERQFEIAKNVYDALEAHIGEAILKSGETPLTQEFLDKLNDTFDIIQDNISKSIKDFNTQDARTINRVAQPFSDGIKGLEIGLKVQNEEINRQRKIDTEALLRALETKFIGGRAELQQSQSQQGRSIQHQANTGELKFNLPQQIATLVSDQGHLDYLKELVLQFKGLDDAQIIKRRNELNSVTSQLATNSNRLIREFLNMEQSLPDASTVEGFTAASKELAQTGIVMDDIREVALKLNIPLSRVSKVMEDARKNITETFRGARRSAVDTAERQGSPQQMRLLQSDANVLAGQGDKRGAATLLSRAIDMQVDAMDKFTEALDEQIGMAAVANDAALVQELLERQDSPEAVAGRVNQLQAVIDILKPLLEVEKKEAVEDDKRSDKISREIRKGSRDFLKSFQAFGAHILGPDNAITELTKGLSSSSLVRQGLGNLQTDKALLDGVSSFSVAAAGIDAAVSIFSSAINRDETRRQKEAAEREKLRKADNELKGDLKSIFSGFEGFDIRLQGLFKPLIQGLENNLKGATTSDKLIDLIRERLSNVDSDTLISDRISELTNKIREAEADRAIAPGEAVEFKIEKEFLTILQQFYPDTTTLRDLELETIRLSDAFQRLIDSTSEVTDAQKQEVRDKFNVEREAVRSRFSQNFSNDPYEQSKQLESLRSQLSAISGSEQAALGALDSGSGYNFPSDFSTILTKFTDSLSTIGGANPAGKISVSPDIDSNVTSDQVIGMQEWLDKLFTLLNISDDSGIKDKVVAYLASLPDELKFNPTGKVLIDIADIVGINIQEFYLSGQAAELREHLKSIPQKAVDGLTTDDKLLLAIDELIEVFGGQGLLLSEIKTTLEGQLALARTELEGAESIQFDVDKLIEVFEGQGLLLSEIRTIVERQVASAKIELEQAEGAKLDINSVLEFFDKDDFTLADIKGILENSISGAGAKVQNDENLLLALNNVVSVVDSEDVTLVEAKTLIDDRLLLAKTQVEETENLLLALNNVISVVDSEDVTLIEARTLIDNRIVQAKAQVEEAESLLLSLDSVISFVDSEDLFLTDAIMLINSQVTAANESVKEAENSILPLNQVLDLDGDLFRILFATLEYRVVGEANQAVQEAVSHNLPLHQVLDLDGDLFRILFASLEYRVIGEANQAVQEAVSHNLPLTDVIAIQTMGFPGRIFTAIDEAVRAGIDIYTAPTYYRYVVDIGPYINIQASGIASRVASAISSGISSGLAQAERQSLSEQYSQESSSPVDRYTPRNGF